LTILDYNCQFVFILAKHVVSEYKTEFSLKPIELVSVLLNLAFDLLALVIKLISELDGFFYLYFSFGFLILNFGELSFELVEEITLSI
jgi:hypothetical protein